MTVATQMKKARCVTSAKIKRKIKERDEEVPWIWVHTGRVNARCRAELTDWIKGIGCEVEANSDYLRVTVPRDRDWRRLMAGLRELYPKVWVAWPCYIEDGWFFEYLRHPNAKFSKYCRETRQFPTMTLFEDWSGITEMRRRAKSEKQTGGEQ